MKIIKSIAALAIAALFAPLAHATSVTGPITKVWIDPAHTQTWAYISTGGSCAWTYMNDADTDSKQLTVLLMLAAASVKTATISYVMVGSNCHITDVTIQF